MKGLFADQNNDNGPDLGKVIEEIQAQRMKENSLFKQKRVASEMRRCASVECKEEITEQSIDKKVIVPPNPLDF